MDCLQILGQGMSDIALSVFQSPQWATFFVDGLLFLSLQLLYPGLKNPVKLSTILMQTKTFTLTKASKHSSECYRTQKIILNNKKQFTCLSHARITMRRRRERKNAGKAARIAKLISFALRIWLSSSIALCKINHKVNKANNQLYWTVKR